MHSALNLRVQLNFDNFPQNKNKMKTNQMKRLILITTLAILPASLIALLLTGCETRIVDPHAASTAALTARKAELQEKERDDAYGIYYGPARWVSHALDEKKSRDELRAIDVELAQR